MDSASLSRATDEELSAKARELIEKGSLKDDFPLFDEPDGDDKPLAYLDSAASSQKPRRVVNAISEFYAHGYSNVHRGIYRLSSEATHKFEGTRETIADLFGAEHPDGVVYTRSTTEAINLVSYSLTEQISASDEIVISEMEHHSNLVPWQLLKQRSGCSLHYVDVTETGELDLDHLRELLGDDTAVVALSHVSNVLGTVNPIAKIGELVREHTDAHFLIDGAQGAPHVPLDLSKIEYDSYAMSAHKMLGPSGIGALIADPELLDELPPFQGGGSMIDKVEKQQSTWDDPPVKFEAGTPHLAGAVGWNAALEYMDDVGMDAIDRHEVELTEYALERFEDYPEVRVCGKGQDRRVGVISFHIDEVHPHDVATILDHHEVAVRAGHHCAQPLMRKLGVPATTRMSLHVYNDREDVDRFFEGLDEALDIFT